MNFARANCDRRVAQSVMRNDAFSLRVGNELKRINLSAPRNIDAGDNVELAGFPGATLARECRLRMA
jgi:hypothetical protein